jgi:hypothetical protein
VDRASPIGGRIAGWRRSRPAVIRRWRSRPTAPRGWGNNEYGQIADGTLIDRPTPAPFPGLVDVKAIAGGGFHTLVLKVDSTVQAMGGNFWGQLGDGTFARRDDLLPVPGLTGIASVAAGRYHSLALKSDGTVWAWGANAMGQVGDGTTANRNSAAPVPGRQVSWRWPAAAITAGAKVDGGRLRNDGPAGRAARRQEQPGAGARIDRHRAGCGDLYSLGGRQRGAWATTPYGQLGNGNSVQASLPRWCRTLGSRLRPAGSMRRAQTDGRSTPGAAVTRVGDGSNTPSQQSRGGPGLPRSPG